MLFQLVEQTVTVGQILPWAATAISVAFNWRLASIASATKLEIKTEAETLRRETKAENDALRRDILGQLEGIRKEMVPDIIAREQRNSYDYRLQQMEKEISINREMHHAQANKVQELLIGPMERINAAMLDRAKRLFETEEKMQGLESRIRDLKDSLGEQIRDVEDRIGDLEKRQ